ncbi:MAG: hypothetical protein ACJ8J0_00105 [Longimicrobiaceae bacterium]
MTEQPPQARAPRTLTYQELRRAAEAAASFRDQEVYLVVDDQGWSVREQRPDNPEGKAVIPIKSPGKQPTAPPPVLIAQIGVDPTKPADLLNLKDPQGNPLGPADAVFWTPAAVEKFLVPYYASVYGDQSPTTLNHLIGILGTPRTPPAKVRSASADVDGAFAVAHMPKSEYVQIDGGVAVLVHSSDGPVAFSVSDFVRQNRSATP